MARKTKAPATPATTTEVRAWARENGLDVASKGRLPQSVKEAFSAKTGQPIAAA